MKKTPNEIAWEVKRYLAVEGVTMAEAASRLGCTQQAVSNQLNGSRPMGRKVAEKWADAFGMNLRFLLSGEGPIVGEEQQVAAPRPPIVIPAETQDMYNNMAKAIADLAEIVRRSGVSVPAASIPAAKNFTNDNGRK